MLTRILGSGRSPLPPAGRVSSFFHDAGGVNEAKPVTRSAAGKYSIILRRAPPTRGTTPPGVPAENPRQNMGQSSTPVPETADLILSGDFGAAWEVRCLLLLAMPAYFSFSTKQPYRLTT